MKYLANPGVKSRAKQDAKSVVRTARPLASWRVRTVRLRVNSPVRHVRALAKLDVSHASPAIQPAKHPVRDAKVASWFRFAKPASGFGNLDAKKNVRRVSHPVRMHVRLPVRQHVKLNASLASLVVRPFARLVKILVRQLFLVKILVRLANSTNPDRATLQLELETRARAGILNPLCHATITGCPTSTRSQYPSETLRGSTVKIMMFSFLSL